MKLFDKNGKSIEVPEDQVQAALASGKYGLAPNPVQMKSSRGELYIAPPETVLEMLNRGFRIETPEEKRKRELQEKYGGAGGQALTAAHAAANTLSFGLVDAVGADLGGKEYVKTVKDLEEANPTTDTVSSLATIAASFAVPGGQAGALGKLSKLGAGVRKVGNIGRKVEQAVIKGLGGPQGGMVRQALVKGTALGAGSGVEGAIYGAGQWVSDASLGDTDATAESLLAHVGMGAMWGGAGGAAFGSGGEVIRRGLGGAANYAKRSSRAIVRMYEKATGVKAAPELAGTLDDLIANPNVRALDKIRATAIGTDPEGMAILGAKGPAGIEARARAAAGMQEADRATTEISDLWDRQQEVLDKFTDQIKGRMKIKNQAEIMKVGNTTETAVIATGLVQQIDDEVADMLTRVDEFGGRSALTRFQKSIRNHKAKINEQLISGADDALPNVFGELDSLKRDLGKYRKQLGRVTLQDDAHFATTGQMEDIYGRLQSHLEDVRLYGDAAKQQARINAPWSRSIGRSPIMNRFKEKIAEKDWRGVYATNRGKVNSHIKALGTSTNAQEERAIAEQLTDEEDLIRAVGETYELTPALKQQMYETSELTASLKAKFADIGKTVKLQNQLGEIITKTSALRSVIPSALSGGVGYLVGGEEGLVAGLALSVMTNPGRMIMLRAAMERMQGSTTFAIGKSLREYVKRATGKLPALKGVIAPASLKILQKSNWGDTRTRDKTRQQAFQKRVGELTSFVANPMQLADRLARNTETIGDVDPRIAQTMQTRAANAAQYLYDHAPKPPNRATMIAGKWKPSDIDLARFERISAVIEDPKEALESLKRGTLTVDEVEALKNCYPKIYEGIVVQLAEQIPQLREDLPYRERVQLSILFGVPVDATMEPNFLAAIQAVSAPPAGMPPQFPETLTGMQLKKDYSALSLDKTSLTSTQRIEANKLA